MLSEGPVWGFTLESPRRMGLADSVSLSFENLAEGPAEEPGPHLPELMLWHPSQSETWALGLAETKRGGQAILQRKGE